MRHQPFYVVDVFAGEPFAGNPLPVVPDADRIDEPTMKGIARELNHSETTFLLTPRVPAADRRLRCFTATGAEVVGAGHNALGAWWWLAASGRLVLDGPRTAFAQEIGERVLPVEVIAEPGRPIAIGMVQASPSFGPVCADVPGLAAALGIPEADLLVDRLPAQVVSTGAAHLLVPVRSRSAVDGARPEAGRLASLLRTIGGQGCYLYCLQPLDPGSTAYARFFNPTVGIAEDPATGSAAGPLACHLAAQGIIGERTEVVVEQGHSMGRPGRIEVSLGGGVVKVIGSAVLVAEGTLLFP